MVERINTALERFLPQGDSVLYQAMHYSLFAGGKRVRPLLCLAGAEAVGGDPEPVLPVACALEMIHTFSLIHDDLPALDNDDLRRGMPTCHKKFGEAMAILAGDALHTLAFTVIAIHQSGDPARVLRVIQLLGEACGATGMVGGQVDDIASEGNPDVTLEQLQSIHARKTGALLTVSVVSGAILSGATEAQVAALVTYGNEIGVAFQIRDDILDVIGTTKTLGKSIGSDVARDKATFPKFYGVEESQRLAEAAYQRAQASLEPFGVAADPLRHFADFIVHRAS
jgi:geranylgeranyl diphosphate synthase type II